jgi:microcystin-dependent protein
MKTPIHYPLLTRVFPLLICLALAPLPAHSQPTPNPPGQMSYQGFLTDGSGVPLATNAPANYDVIFRVYTVPTGGAALWGEIQTVTVDRGYFSVLLGQGANDGSDPWTNNLVGLFTGANASDRYVGVTVKGITNPDSEIAPRLRLLASPYALLAANAISASSIVNSTNSQVATIIGTNFGINNPNPGTTLDVGGTVTATGLKVNGAAAVEALNASTVTATTVTVNGSATVSGSVAAASFSGNGTIPVGGIILWSGSPSAVPAGWALCNGQSGTPNLLDRFVVGAGNSYSSGANGGSTSQTLTVAQMPSHQHAFYSTPTGSGSYYAAIPTGTPYVQVPSAAGTSYVYPTTSTGGGQSFSIMPPYYALAFIMRVQ